MDSSIHLYVDDSYHPVSSPIQMRKIVNAIEGKPALIPCRPSSPDFDVGLVKLDDVHFPYTASYYYHPRLGFIFEE